MASETWGRKRQRRRKQQQQQQQQQQQLFPVGNKVSPYEPSRTTVTTRSMVCEINLYDQEWHKEHCFITRHDMKTYGGVKVWLQTFLTSIQAAGKHHGPVSSPPSKQPPGPSG
jgi:hypothetical protein